MNHSFDLKLFIVDVDHKIVLNKVFASSLMNLPRFEARKLRYSFIIITCKSSASTFFKNSPFLLFEKQIHIGLERHEGETSIFG